MRMDLESPAMSPDQTERASSGPVCLSRADVVDRRMRARSTSGAVHMALHLHLGSQAGRPSARRLARFSMHHRRRRRGNMVAKDGGGHQVRGDAAHEPSQGSCGCRRPACFHVDRVKRLVCASCFCFCLLPTAGHMCCRCWSRDVPYMVDAKSDRDGWVCV